MRRAVHSHGRATLSLLLVLLVLSLFSPSLSAAPVEALVKEISKDGASVTLDVGRNDGIEPGDVFHAFGIVKFVNLPFSGGRKLVEVTEPIALLHSENIGLSTTVCKVELVKPEYRELLKVGCICRRIERSLETNKPPVIKQLLLGESSLGAGSVCSLKLDCNDPNGDGLVYRWKSTGGYLEAESTHFPLNTLYIPADVAGDSVTVDVTVDDRRENGAATRSFALPLSRQPLDKYVNSQFTQRRIFQRTFTGDRFNVDDVCVLENGRIALLDIGRTRKLHIFDHKMRPVASIAEMTRAVDVLTKGNDIYVLEVNKVTKYSDSGDKKQEFFFDDAKSNAYIQEPERMWVLKGGDVCVIAKRGVQIKVFDPQGIYRLSVGLAGQQPGAFMQPVALAEDKFGNVYVLDAQRKDIQRFSAGFKVDPEPIGIPDLDIPIDMQYDSVIHTLFVLDVRGRIREIPLENKAAAKVHPIPRGSFKRFWRTPDNIFYLASDIDGSSVLQRFVPGKGVAWYQEDNFVGIAGVATDKWGTIALLCPDSKSGIVRLLDRNGWHYSSMISRGSEQESVRTPSKLMLSPDGSKFFISDSGTRVVEFSNAGNYVTAYPFESLVDFDLDEAGVLYCLDGNGTVFRCENNNREQVAAVTNSRIARKSEKLEVCELGKRIFIANSGGYNFLHFHEGNLKETFPSQKSGIKRFTSLGMLLPGAMLLLDERDEKLTSVYVSGEALTYGAATPISRATTMAITGCAEAYITTDRSELLILRMPFLDHE